MKITKCLNAATAKVILDCDENCTITMFTNIIDKLVGADDIQGDTLAVKLLSAPKHTFSVADNNVVMSIRRNIEQ